MPNRKVQDFIKNYSERLSHEEFNVSSILEPEKLPPLINGVRPEIFAENGELKRIIVVKDEGFNWSSEELQSLREYTRANQAISYWEFSIRKDGQWRLIENIM